jgi:fumarate reductase flavoprotein subunit
MAGQRVEHQHVTQTPATVIVGAGTAGLAAAVTAGELGQHVVVIEKTRQIGGMLHWSSGHFSAAGTRLQRERGISDTPQEHFDDVMTVGHGLNDADLVTLAVETVPETVDWLEELGFSFGSSTPTLVPGHELYSKPRTYWGGEDPAAGGQEILRVLTDHLDRQFADIRLETELTGIVLGGSPGDLTVRGVEVAHGGATEVIEANRVVLATGGYAASRSMVTDLQPHASDALSGCMPHATGDAHRLLMDLGVEIVGAETYLPTMGMIEDPDRPGRGLRLTIARLIVDTSQRRPWEIWVNRAGERFVNEDAASPYEREKALLAQPNLRMHAIWDRNVAENASPPLGPDWTWDRVEAESQRNRWLYRANGLEELATLLGINGEALKATAAAYGPDGVDAFGRKHRPVSIERPPFYGVRVTGGMLLSRGGPRVDDELRPIDATGAPIRGLHAVGELLGMTQFSGDSFAGGMSVGPALALGRLLIKRNTVNR